VGLFTFSHGKNGVHKSLDQFHDAMCQDGDLFNIGEWGTQRYDQTNKRHQTSRSLSTFLFLLCTEGLTGLLNRAAHQGHIKGYSLCRNSPRLTHLLFADDSLLFCRFTIEECHRVLDILDVYGKCLGQQISQSKTTIFFSKSTKVEFRNQIKLALGVLEII